jgi:quercetin dioxygenase-like cupin family protein
MSEQTEEPAIVRGEDVEYETVDAAEGLAKGVLVGEDEGAPNFAMRRFTLDAGAEVPRHTNEVEHVQYVLAGEYTVGIEGDERTVAAGDSLYVPAGAVHWYRNDGDEQGAFICVVPHGDDDIQVLE